jgi:hypothetical protein
MADDTPANDFGLAALDPDKRDETLEAVGRVIYEAVFLRVMDLLDEAGQAEFEKVLTDAKSGDEILAFLEERVPNLDAIVQEEVQKFKSESTAFMKKLNA